MYTSHPNVTLGYAAKDGVSPGRWDDAYMTEDETGERANRVHHSIWYQHLSMQQPN